MANNPEPHASSPSWLAAFWRVLKLIDKSKLNGVALALRNSLAVALPLAIGITSGNPLGGVAIASGALNVAFSDGVDPYAQRARRMLAWSFLGALAAFLGSITGHDRALAILVAALWALLAGMLVSISTRAADLGLNTLVSLIVYGARGAMSPKGAFYAGLLVLGGGLLQTAITLLSWPLRRRGPEQRAVGKVYADLAREVDPRTKDVLSVPVNQPSAQVQDTLSALGRDHSLEGERFRLLLDQAERLRFSVYYASRLLPELSNEARKQNDSSSQALAERLEEILDLSSKLLGCIGESLLSGKLAPDQSELIQRLRELLEEIQSSKKGSGSPLAAETASATDTLAGQLRLVAQMAAHTTPKGAEQFAQQELAPPWNLQVMSWLATLRANLDLRSTAYRHAIRLAVCVALSDTIARSINLQRNYWLPMTVAVVLKPDFTTTLSRGVLRLCGTLAGLVLATALFHIFPVSALTQLVLVGLFTFSLRYIGPANYGVFSVAISGLVVFLIAATGVPPAQVVAQRATNTGAGGVFALLAYALWPTWERTKVSEAIADMIDRSRDYFRAVVGRFSRDDDSVKELLDSTRREWRRARSTAEASVDRVASEPGISAAQLANLTSMLASSHILIYAVMSLEAEVMQRAARPLPPTFETFSHDVEFTLYFLAAALRGSHAASQHLPKLREDHRRLIEGSGDSSQIDEYVLIETDRLTVSLNTLSEQVLRYVT